MARKKAQTNHVHIIILSIASLLLFSIFLVQNSTTSRSKSGNNGFDEFGYNYTARTFNGSADGVDRNLDKTVWGDPAYANDKIKMTWSKAWDDARFNGKPWTCDAWEDNQWNGKFPDASGEIWHYRIVWVGPELKESSCWREGGSPIWDQFEVIFSQGTVGNEHFWDVHASPAGYGVF